MRSNSPAVITVIGLPIFLLLALGLAFGASFVSRTLRADPTLETVSTQTSIANTNTLDAKYAQALTTLTTSIYQRMIQSGTLSNIAANQTSAANSAQVVLAGVCWLAITPSDLQFFPTGAVQDNFTTLIELYGSPTATDAVCTHVTAAAELQASRLMTLDDDGDGLNTIAEYWYDTNQFSKDTDQDGFPDAEEITNGFNPLGPGATQPQIQ